ncbi:hypothetical protein ANCCAN_02181 [Ancylostoma caninum]|uniref:Uncharacterized protein n=1 Tax=Ancylostoma caninum TaxID=29170 RepID=A0A368H8A5_ANCCA|nr:hypothetical protein ANCCAN_02181 [Ancylostoma caninum]
MAAAFIRDSNIDRHVRSKRVCALTTVCLAGFIFTVINRTVTLFRPYLGYLFDDVVKTYCFVIPTVMVLLFVVIYGDCEYIIDLWELYPEDSVPRYILIKPTGSTNMRVYYDLPALTILMTILGTTDIGAVREERKLSPVSYYLAVGLVALVIIAYFLRGFSHAWRRNEWSSLFCITPEHPSFIRINSQAVEQEQIIVPQALLNAIYSAEVKEKALKTAPLPADSIKEVQKKPSGDDDLAKTQVSFLAGVDSKEQPPTTPTDTKGSSAESHPTSKGTSISIPRQSREEGNSREKGGGRSFLSTRP